MWSLLGIFAANLCCLAGSQDIFLAADHSTNKRDDAQVPIVSDQVSKRFGFNDAQRSAADQLLTVVSGHLNQPAKDGGRWRHKDSNGAETAPLNVVMLDAAEGNSRCMDGSPYGFYFRPAPPGSAHQKDWVVYMEGGGLCITIFDCLARAKSDLGSSKHWPGNHTDEDNMVSSNASTNPFSDFNHVWLPYCSGDTHTGKQTSRNAYGIFFAGALNFEAAVERLRRDHGLGQADRLILSGGSAGGIGTHNNVDWLQSALPSTKVSGLPQAGLFFPKAVELSLTQILRVLHILSPVVEINSLLSAVVTELYDSRLPLPCANQTGPEQAHRCWDGGYNYDFVTTPMLYVNNMYDSLEIEEIMLCIDCPKWAREYIAYFGMKVRNTLKHPPRNSSRRNSVWVPACYEHTGTLCLGHTMSVGGQRLTDVARDWFFKGVDVTSIDACASTNSSQPCNEACSAFSCHDM